MNWPCKVLMVTPNGFRVEYAINPYMLDSNGKLQNINSLTALKQWTAARMDGGTATVGAYLGHLQELFITLGGNTIAFFALVDSGNLNFLSAISIGYVMNSVADLNPAGGRSTTLK